MYRLTVFLTALAPAIWGSSYIVATELLPNWPPLLVAALRALLAGLLLLSIVRSLPAWRFVPRLLVLGALNFSLFWALLFVSAYRLPGGVAAVLGAVQPLFVLLLSTLLLSQALRLLAVVASLGGIVGVGLLVLTPDAAFDPIGLAAGLGAAASMALGTVLSRKWAPPVPALTFAAWQLTAGGVLLSPALLLLGAAPALTANGVIGLVWLGGIGGALTYLLWFRGIAQLGPTGVAPLGFFSPVTAMLLGWILLGEAYDARQSLGIALIFGSIWLSQNRPAPAAPRPVTPSVPTVVTSRRYPVLCRQRNRSACPRGR